jgi:hypothetical protein
MLTLGARELVGESHTVATTYIVSPRFFVLFLKTKKKKSFEHKIN